MFSFRDLGMLVLMGDSMQMDMAPEISSTLSFH